MNLLLTTGCPKCMVAKKKLDDAGVLYEELSDMSTIQSYGVSAVPVLVLEDGTQMDFKTLVSWIKEGNT